MPKKPPRYSPAVQRSAVEQVMHHRRPVTQVARQLRCSPQSIKNFQMVEKLVFHRPPSILTHHQAKTQSGC